MKKNIIFVIILIIGISSLVIGINFVDFEEKIEIIEKEENGEDKIPITLKKPEHLILHAKYSNLENNAVDVANIKIIVPAEFSLLKYALSAVDSVDGTGVGPGTKTLNTQYTVSFVGTNGNETIEGDDKSGIDFSPLIGTNVEWNFDHKIPLSENERAQFFYRFDTNSADSDKQYDVEIIVNNVKTIYEITLSD